MLCACEAGGCATSLGRRRHTHTAGWQESGMKGQLMAAVPSTERCTSRIATQACWSFTGRTRLVHCCGPLRPRMIGGDGGCLSLHHHPWPLHDRPMAHPTHGGPAPWLAVDSLQCAVGSGWLRVAGCCCRLCSADTPLLSGTVLLLACRSHRSELIGPYDLWEPRCARFSAFTPRFLLFCVGRDISDKTRRNIAECHPTQSCP